MKNKIHIIEVENNEKESTKKILKNIKEKKIIYIKNRSHEYEEIYKAINIRGPAVILNSSGSSGKPRKCIHKLENLYSSAKASGIWLERQGFKLKHCLVFNTLPLNHISGLMPLFRSQIWDCEHINISPALIKNPKELVVFTNKIKKDKHHLITSLVPIQLKRLLSEKNGIDWLKIFDLIWIGGASLSIETSRKCRFEKINLAPCYGSTETAAMVTSLKPKEFLEGLDNVGEILTDIKLRISKNGLIQIQSDRIGIELLESYQTKNFKDKNGWWESSDSGEIQKLNNSLYLKFIRRTDNAFNSGGEIVFPEVIKLRLNEFILNKKIPIENFIISNIPNKEWGNKMVIIINFKKQTDKTNIEYSLKLLKNFSKNWPKHERPKNWIIGKPKKDDIKNSNYMFTKL
ncbi:probable O-succinylbenzoic acid--CoA ligase (OSB-CoA synthetase) [Prochlorococcus marinus str. MIT 9515]|uniref:Probable O-succinylbenzoic acid--CoA ligase (OSB-CoA synthetase) n=1 Tax=Prochlorococcus marinus (strain MIT 9515) TaxID=167542 RepID=A2BUF1_PROM5|nr:AMP-binding protein [Prochlorococcus marinus]ABM71412.1 probable O-succinylbenzoic acid--CoA ligase (OSB-CoA synthetase) [Prochlorococcus marinus str. MIT 9515]